MAEEAFALAAEAMKGGEERHHHLSDRLNAATEALTLQGMTCQQAGVHLGAEYVPECGVAPTFPGQAPCGGEGCPVGAVQARLADLLKQARGGR